MSRRGRGHRLSLALLGTRVEVASDDRELLDGLAFVYARVPAAAQGRPRAATLRRVDRPERAAADLRLEARPEEPRAAAGEPWRGLGARLRDAGAGAAIGLAHALAPDLTSHYLIHAGAVDLGAGGVLLVAPSGGGKSTLAAALALRGAAFLGDDLAPLARASGEVEPFPRALGLRPGPLTSELARAGAGAGAACIEERDGGAKLLVDLLAHPGVRPARPARARHVVFLHPATAVTRLRLELERPAPGVAARLRGAPGVLSVEPTGAASAPALDLRCAAGTRVAAAIDEACRAHAVRLVRLVREEELGPRFAGEPRLSPLAAAAGVLRLARFVAGGAGGQLLAQGCHGRPGRLILELGERLRQARFWELRGGELEAMCRRVEELP